MLSSIVEGKLDVLLISETKINESFSSASFEIPGFATPYRVDKTANEGGVMLYVRSDIPSKLVLFSPLPETIQGLFIEINLFKIKWLIGGFYNPNKLYIEDFLKDVGNCLDIYLNSYENLIIMGDLNSEITERAMHEFCDIFNLKSLISEPTCFKNIMNPSCIDLILTNRNRCFQNSTVVETGISDHHKLTVTVLKTVFKKKKAKSIIYRDYKLFSNETFSQEFSMLIKAHREMNNLTFSQINDICLFLLNKHAPVKQKIVRGNDGLFMTKKLRKEIMVRSRLKNNYHKNKTEISFQAYKTQRNLCTSLLRNTKLEYFNSLKTSDLNDVRKFWKIIKPIFGGKRDNGDINLVDNSTIISSDNAASEIFVTFNIVSNLNINFDDKFSSYKGCLDDPVNISVFVFKNHPSVKTINEKLMINEQFHFSEISVETMFNEILKLDLAKATPKDSIPGKIIKDNIIAFSVILTENFNKMLRTGEFPEKLKLADVSPIHKKGDKTNKCNYRPVSILPIISKIYEKLLFYQLCEFFEDKLSIFQCGFRKGFSAQHCLIPLLEKWRAAVDNSKSFGTLLTDLSKAFACLPHELLIAKLHAYGVVTESLRVIYNYLKNRKQRVRINTSYSSWYDLLYGVPQGSILGPLLFNIYLTELFFLIEKSSIANYADDCSLYSSGDKSQDVIKTLENDSKILFNWFETNGMKANPDKSHLILSNSDTNLYAEIDSHKINNQNEVDLLGITIDNKLTFNKHMSKLCRKASKKLHALMRVAKYMTETQRKSVMTSFIYSQFQYCPLIWIFHNREFNNRINKIHERAMRIVFRDYNSEFSDLLKRNNVLTVHERSIQNFAIELFKVKNNLSPKIMQEVFKVNKNENYKLRRVFDSRNIFSVQFGIKSLTYLAPKIWSLIPDDMKKESSFLTFKKRIAKWKVNKCPCKLCEPYVKNLGFVSLS